MSDQSASIKSLVCELCRQFYTIGWVTGTGGSISIKLDDVIYMTPSGVQKERIQPDELFGVNSDGKVVVKPEQKYDLPEPKLSDCAPLFLHAYNQRNAGAVLHSHAICCNLVTSLFAGKNEFTISHQEMIKGIDGYGYFDKLVIPIIENTAYEHELADTLGETMAKYPRTCAILVRRHGMYVWGKSWEQAKRHGECLHYLFEVAIKMHELGMDFNSPPTSNSEDCPVSVLGKRSALTIQNGVSNKRSNTVDNNLPTHIVLDIEGTTTPISFVKEVLFPYSLKHMRDYLTRTWESDVTKSIVADVVSTTNKDAKEKTDVPATILAPLTGGNSPPSLDAVTAYIEWCIAHDKKVTPVKKLQGLTWESGYKDGSLISSIYDDVPTCLARWVQQGIKICIYSSGSKQAQKLLFKYSDQGDLCSSIGAYFDTSVGAKQKASSYSEILLTVGATDEPSRVWFVTDIVAEGTAASAAGMTAIISLRPGNLPIQDKHSFKTISSFDEIL